MDWKLSIVFALIVTGLFPALTTYVWVYHPVGYRKEEAVDLALHFLRNAPTFRFDGMPNTITVEEVATLRMPWTWEVAIAFQNRHPGYGDRTGKILPQVIIPHVIRVVVSQGRVLRALIDDRWDEINQREVG